MYIITSSLHYLRKSILVHSIIANIKFLRIEIILTYEKTCFDFFSQYAKPFIKRICSKRNCLKKFVLFSVIYEASNYFIHIV